MDYVVKFVWPSLIRYVSSFYFLEVVMFLDTSHVRFAHWIVAQMVLSYKPLAEHFRAAVQRKGSRSDQVSVIVLTVLDAKITSQCKAIDHLAENNPAHAAALVAMAAAECPTLELSDDRLWIRRVEPFSSELVSKLFNEQVSSDGEEETCSSNGVLSYEAVYISAFTDKDAVSINLTASPNSYYLDAIAQELDVPDAGHVFMSRYVFSTV